MNLYEVTKHVQNNIVGLKDIKLIHAKWQPPNLKRMLQIKHLACSSAQTVHVNAGNTLYCNIFVPEKYQ